MWLGADPGGINSFGMAALANDGTFETICCSSVDEAVSWLKAKPAGVGIDCPLWWSSAAGGGREVDRWLRETFGIHPGTVQSVNSLKGAVVVQGVLLAMRLRGRFPDLPITETHPKALLKALAIGKSWGAIAERFNLQGDEPRGEHERDALLGAVAVRNGVRDGWRDISLQRGESELDPKNLWFGPVSYLWPTDVAQFRAP